MPEDDVELNLDDAVDEISADLFTDGETPEVEAPAVEETPAVEEPVVTENSAEVVALGAPDTWTKEAIADWATIPPRAQQEILKREADMIKGFEQVAQYRDYAETYNKIISPYSNLFQQYNVNPAEMLSSFANAHATFSFGQPQEKLALAQHLLSSYGIDPVELALSMGGKSAEPPNPEIVALRNEVAQLRQGQQSVEQREQQAALAAANEAVSAFASDPKNIYFKEVENDIVNLLSTGAARTLPEAYEKAVWTNPQVREKEVARLAAERAPAPPAKADPRAAALASNVDTKQKPGNGAMPVGSLDDTLLEAYQALNS